MSTSSPPIHSDKTIYDNPKKVSAYCWKYFGLHKDDTGAFITDYVWCRKCSVSMKHSGNTTSSMNTHLKFKHGITSLTSAAEDDNRKPPKISSFIAAASPTADHPKAEKITLLVCNLIVGACLPYSIVEKEDFIALMRMAFPGYKLPCRSTITSKIFDLAEQKRLELKNRLASIPPGCISCTHDGWTSRDNVTYGGTSAHFFDLDWIDLHECCLGMSVQDGGKADNIEKGKYIKSFGGIFLKKYVMFSHLSGMFSHLSGMF